MVEAIVPITGRQLALPDGPLFKLQRAAEGGYELAAFRPWAGYKTFGVEKATDGLALLQHVLSFAPSEHTGRTGVHGHFAHAHIVIPTSGRGVFSYDGVITPAVPGQVIVQHGGTIHDQFQYSYSAADEAENRQTPLFVEPEPPGAPPRSFAFLELFVPCTMANVEIVAPGEVTLTDQRTAWRHPYHTPGAGFAVQSADAPEAAYRPVAGRDDLEARDCCTWGPSGGLAATWIIRPASAGATTGESLNLDTSNETGGIDILFMVAGSGRFRRKDGEGIVLNTGDTLTCDQGAIGDPFDCSPDMRLLRFLIAAKVRQLRERTPEEIGRLEALGASIITYREVRPDGDARPVNCLQADPAMS